MSKKTTTKSLLAVFTAAMMAMPWNVANGASSDIAVNVSVGAHIILNTVATVNLTVTGVDAAAAPAGVVAGTVSFAGNPNTVAAGGVLGWADPAAYGNLIDVSITDAWGVRAMLPAGQSVQLTPSISVGTATNGASQVTVGSLTASCAACDAGNPVAAGSPIAFAPPGMANPGVSGDVNFQLDISGVTVVGNHTGIILTITAAAV